MGLNRFYYVFSDTNRCNFRGNNTQNGDSKEHDKKVFYAQRDRIWQRWRDHDEVKMLLKQHNY